MAKLIQSAELLLLYLVTLSKAQQLTKKRSKNGMIDTSRFHT
jgi:hypothetical protein